MRARSPPVMGGLPDPAPLPVDTDADERGADLWDFLASFVHARHQFASLFARYERRVLKAARERGVSRDSLVLPPPALFGLFHLGRMEHLRDARLAPLRRLAERAFADSSPEELLDVYCSHIYHEFTILTEEHRSVGRFLRIRDARRYRQLFEEVSGYYPMRLRRIRRLFTGGLRRIEVLLPSWSRHRVMVRSVYLFGDQLARKAYGQGIASVYHRMYPRGGMIEGYLEAARSFMASGFLPRARRAADRSLAAIETLERRRPLEPDERRAAEAARTFREDLDAASDGARGAVAVP
jgi:hypothetical protein